ncbi:MAG: hypothetical protein DWQ04_19560 [Chloroflexi bacterium]|nr:MAG: hypothetical protein DWQ04_19560 [Chloroflexota bacterium]
MKNNLGYIWKIVGWLAARLETAVISYVRDSAILDTLRNNPKSYKFIGESLGDFTTAVPNIDSFSATPLYSLSSSTLILDEK